MKYDSLYICLINYREKKHFWFVSVSKYSNCGTCAVIICQYQKFKSSEQWRRHSILFQNTFVQSVYSIIAITTIIRYKSI